MRDGLKAVPYEDTQRNRHVVDGLHRSGPVRLREHYRRLDLAAAGRRLLRPLRLRPAVLARGCARSGAPYFLYTIEPTTSIEAFGQVSMVNDVDDTQESPESAPPMTVCAMCHRSVPASQIINLGGRPLCFGCMTAWFDEDEE